MSQTLRVRGDTRDPTASPPDWSTGAASSCTMRIVVRNRAIWCYRDVAGSGTEWLHALHTQLLDLYDPLLLAAITIPSIATSISSQRSAENGTAALSYASIMACAAACAQELPLHGACTTAARFRIAAQEPFEMPPFEPLQTAGVASELLNALKSAGFDWGSAAALVERDAGERAAAGAPSPEQLITFYQNLPEFADRTLVTAYGSTTCPPAAQLRRMASYAAQCASGASVWQTEGAFDGMRDLHELRARERKLAEANKYAHLDPVRAARRRDRDRANMAKFKEVRATCVCRRSSCRMTSLHTRSPISCAATSDSAL